MRRDKKEVRSGQEAGFSAEPTRIDMQSSSTRSSDETARQTSVGRRIVGVLASGLGRRSSSHNSPTDSPNSPSLLVRRQFAFPILAVLAVAALGLWLLLPGGALRAQDAAIEYPENGDEAVATYTATDPEDRDIYWSLLPANTDADLNNDGDTDDTGERGSDNPSADMADFSISEDGVLSFNIPPDYEDADDDGTNNEYHIVVVASDNSLGAGTTDNPTKMGYKKVVVTVTDEDERGMVTLSSLQPQVGVTLTATLMDGDATDTQITDAEWKWEKSQDMSSWAPIDGAGAANTHEVGSTADDYYLRVTATYTDSHGSKKTAEAVSVNKVRMAPTTTDADAAFPSGSDARRVDENSPAGTDVGKPVEATDTQDDVLTYSLSGANASSFEIDPATGQITVGPRTMLDHETTPSYSVTVTAREASGDADATAIVAITVNDMNEAPMVTEGVTMRKLAEYDADTDDAGADDEDTRARTVSTYTASDPEVTTLRWTLEGADASDFTIPGGVLTFKKAPNYEMPADAGGDNTYNVTVVATDNGITTVTETGGDGENKMTAKRAVTIMVTNVEEDGTVTLTAQQPKIGVELTASVTDIDDDVTGVTWKWERDDNVTDDPDNTGDMEEVIKGATSATYTPTDDDMGQYLRAIASYTDGNGKDTSMATTAVVVVVRTDNPPKFPSAEDGKRSIDEGMTGDVGVAVRATDKETAQLLTYSLSGADMSSFTITSDTSDADNDRGGQIAVKAGTKLDHEDKATYMVTVTATDPGGLDASIDVTITVGDIDEAPEVTGDATKDYAENGDEVVATYTATDPEDRDIYWSLLPANTDADLNNDGDTDDTGERGSDNPSADMADFSISEDGVLSFNIPPDYEDADDDGTNNEYHIVVVASDNSLGAGTTDNPTKMGYKKVVVTVTDKDERGMITLSSLQPQVGVTLTATLTDPEAPSPANLEWEWEKSTSGSSGWAAIDEDADAEMYEPVDTTESNYLRVTATYDDANGDERTAQARSVMKVREAPTTSDETASFPSGSDARRVDENSPAGTDVGKPVEATDTQDDVLTYSLSGANASSFEIDPATGQITVGPRTMLDHETTPSYSVTVTAREASGDADATAIVAITVNDMNEAPMVTEGVTMRKLAEYDADTDDAGADDEDTRARTVSTYTASDPEVTTLRWTLEGADASDFTIPGGVLTFKKAPNYEMPADAGGDNTYNVTVVATDNGITTVTETGGDGENKMTAKRAVTIMVTNVEEDGTVTLTAQQPKIGVELTASVTDIDDDVTGVTWKWERDDNVTDDPDNTGDMEEVIKGATSATYTPTDDDMGQYLRAIASYTDGNGKDTSMATSVAVVVVRTDNPPKFPTTEDGKRSIEEGMTGDVGDPVTAMDDDENQVLTYSLSGADMASFSIAQDDASTANENEGGQIAVKAGTKLDHEDKATYMVTVTATDPDGLDASIDVTIKVTNVNEAPEIIVGGLAITGPASVSYAEDRSDPVGTYDLAGPDSDSGRWTTLGGADAGDFRISGGVLTFARTTDTDFETPADADENNVYMVTLNARDSEGNTAMRNVMVTVTDVDDTVSEDTLLGTYDTSGNGEIELEEMRIAVRDFFNDDLTPEEMRELVRIYF